MVGIIMMMWSFILVGGIACVAQLFVIGYHCVMRRRQAILRHVMREWWDTQCARLCHEIANPSLSKEERRHVLQQWRAAERQRLRVALVSLLD